MNRSLSFSDLWTFMECPHEYLSRIRGQKSKRTKEQVVGDATHAIAENGGTQTADIREFIEKEIARLPQSERAETLERIEQIAENARTMAEGDEEDGNDTDREEVYRWLFESTGWTLCAKPDKVEIVREGDRRILEISDYKSGNSHEIRGPDGSVIYRAKRKHREQLLFFALVLSRAMNWTGPIRLRIRYWGNKSECPPIWYSHYRSRECLNKIALQIRRIESLLNGEQIQPRAGFWCKTCPRAQNCEAAQKQRALESGIEWISTQEAATA